MSTCEDPPSLQTADTVLDVYTGAAVNALAVIATNDDAAAFCGQGSLGSRVVFNATGGQAYRIRVSGFIGGTALGPDFVLRVAPYNPTTPLLDSTPLAFGNQPVGTLSASRTVRVINRDAVATAPLGTATMAPAGAFPNNTGDEYQITRNTCSGNSVAVDASCICACAFSQSAPARATGRSVFPVPGT